MDKIYFIEVNIKKVEVNDEGIGRVNQNCNLHYVTQSKVVEDIYNKLMDIANNFEKISLGGEF